MFYKNKKFKLSEFRIATFDCEAVKFNNETKEGGGSNDIDMVGFYDGKDYFCFRKGIDFLEYIWQNLEKYNKTYIYAHNFSGYDIYSFLDDIKTYFINNFRVVEIGGRFVEFTLYKKINGKEYCVIFRDSYKILPSKLAKLGESFGYPKTEQPPFDHKIYNNAQIGGEMYYKQMYNEVMKYNKNDCVILYNILKEFFEHTPYTFSSIPLTAPSLAFKTWQQMMKLKMCSELTDAWKYDDFIRKSYAGGRTEVFKMSVDNDEYCYLDVNCYSEDTECWTEYGWKRYNELKIGMKVMTYNTKKKKMEMKPIQKIIINHYKGDMHHYTGKNVDCLVTPNHNMIIKQHITFDEEEWVSSKCPINCLFPNREDNSWSPCDKSIVEYEGIVWCITVDNHNFLTMRNNRKAWQGNSIYPAEMESKPLPVGQCSMFYDEENSRTLFEKGTQGFYEVEWIAPHDLHIPILWEKRDSKLIFPLNKQYDYKGNGVYAYPELKLAVDNGYKLKFSNCAVFFEMKILFKEYVAHYKKLKFEGGAKKEIAKIFLNSVYGKLGQRTIMKSCVKLTVQEVIEYLEEGEEVTPVDLEMGLYNVTSHRMSQNIVVAWASYITAYARIRMWENIKACDYQVAYMDTDSIVVKKEQAHNVWIEKDTFGASKREYEVHKACFFAPKFYLMSAYDNDKKKETEILKIKGVHDFATKSIIKLGYEKAKSYLLEMAKNNLGIKTISFVQFKMSRKLLNKPRAGSSRVMEKQIHLDYAKRKVLENGIDTEPL